MDVINCTLFPMLIYKACVANAHLKCMDLFWAKSSHNLVSGWTYNQSYKYFTLTKTTLFLNLF